MHSPSLFPSQNLAQNLALNLALKLAVPVAFFGYALVANLALFSVEGARLPHGQDLLSGKVAQAIDGLYRDNLPHKAPSIGLIGAARYLVLNEGRAGVVVGRDDHLFTAEEFRPITPAPYDAALHRIERAATALKAAGVQLVMAPLPAKLDLMRDLAPKAEAGAAMGGLYRQFLSDLQAQGLATVDTRPALAAMSAPFLTTDTHWTPAAARAVAARIAASGMIAPGDTGFTVEPGGEATFSGDLVSYVTSDTWAGSVGLPAEHATLYRAVAPASASGPVFGLTDLFGDTGGGVDLVGTSYSANPNWSFGEALKLELGRDVINHAEEGRGPFAPMTTYLEQLDPLALPETVIWEIPVRYLTDPDLAIERGAS